MCAPPRELRTEPLHAPPAAVAAGRRGDDGGAVYAKTHVADLLAEGEAATTAWLPGELLRGGGGLARAEGGGAFGAVLA